MIGPAVAPPGSVPQGGPRGRKRDAGQAASVRAGLASIVPREGLQLVLLGQATLADGDHLGLHRLLLQRSWRGSSLDKKTAVNTEQQQQTTQRDMHSLTLLSSVSKGRGLRGRGGRLW